MIEDPDITEKKTYLVWNNCAWVFVGKKFAFVDDSLK